jgi:DNA-binding SARP family transcriptional activator
MSNLPRFQVCLLGGFSLTVDSRPQTRINQPQQQSLLAYLMLQTHTPQLRRHIAFLFWPDSSEDRAHANLRRALHKLRSDCPAIEH